MGKPGPFPKSPHMDSQSECADICYLVRRLSRIQDMRQRSYALATRLTDRDPVFTLDVIKAISERALQGDEDSLRLYNGLMLSGALAEVLGSRKISELISVAQERGDDDVIAVFLELQPEGFRGTPRQPFLDRGLRDVPLGMRKALARKPDVNVIRQIARDQDHRVIRHLLDNPRLTEADVIRIAATRPTSPQVLEEIYRHPRWITRYAVKKVIVFNPHSPLNLSLKLICFLNAQDIEELCDDQNRNPELLIQGLRILEEKTGHQSREKSLE
jgi:hypothetical protein